MYAFDDTEQRAEAYRIMADFFISPPEEDMLDAIRNDFQLEFPETAAEISVDFQELLSYPAGTLQPIASLYQQGGMSAPDAVSAAYAQAGLVLDEGVGLPPDHLYLELRFFSHLVESGQVRDQKNFLEANVMNWVPRYCEELGRRAKTAFYRNISALVKEFLALEYELYGE